MLNMTYDTDAAKFSLATPDDLKQASEKAMNFWVGAMSPLWMPFWAASGFGLGAWAMSRSLLQSEDVLKELPLAARWPGFTPLWGQKDFAPETQEDVALAPMEATQEAMESVAEVTAPAMDVVETIAEPVVEEVEKVAEPVLDPVAEVPVVPAVLEAIAEPAIAEPVKAEAKATAPKPIAKDLAVAKPAPKAKPKA